MLPEIDESDVQLKDGDILQEWQRQSIMYNDDVNDFTRTSTPNKYKTCILIPNPC